jgi:hypothetical protein
VVGSDSLSWGWQNLTTRTGAVQQTPASPSPQKLFDQLFKNGVPSSDGGSTTPPPRDAGTGGPRDAGAPVARRPVVDRVLESYNQLQSGAFGDARRLSAADKQALSDHMDRLRDLEARLTPATTDAGSGMMTGGTGGGSGSTSNAPSASCSSVSRPTSTSSSFQLYNDVIAAAFLCDMTRVASIVAFDPFVQFTGDWHTDYAHEAGRDAGKEATVLESHRVFFETVFLDLANKLDVVEANGKTVLDNSLLFWTHECSWDTHNDFSMPIVTAGSAAGYLNTGLYVDYRNRAAPNAAGNSPDAAAGTTADWFPGLTYHQWLGTALQAIGVQPSEFERNGKHGYGVQRLCTDGFTVNNPSQAWPQRVFDDASSILPLLKA